MYIYNCAGNIIYLCQSHSQKAPPDKEYDQLIYFAIQKEQISVEIFNRDGSKAGNCLNGMRALSHLLYTDFQLKLELCFVQDGIEIARGHLHPQIEVSVPMPTYVKSEFDVVNLGNTHHVHWYCDKELVKDKNYIPNVNEEYILKQNSHEFTVRVFENGVGETGSCGSGAVAVGVSILKRLGLKEIVVHYPGGNLNVKFFQDRVFLAGPTNREK